jgi:AIPR protein
LFDLNLRYEVRNSSVNGEIIQSLCHSKSRKNFHHYNNGLIIVTDNYSIRDQDNVIRLSGAQIVNGLQTVKSIYNAVSDKQVSISDLDDDCVVPVKIIKNSEAKFVASVVRATNNQNPMAQRNLRSNAVEQKLLRKGFQMLSPRWFYQVKEGEWDSLTSEQSRFFEQVVGFKASDFKPIPSKKAGRVIDNQEAAKAWLAFIGFGDEAGDRVTHFFAEDKIYDLAFSSRPTAKYWESFSNTNDWDKGREELLESKQGEASQYLLAFFIWQFVNGFVPSPQKYREMSLNEGVAAGKIKKASGSFTSNEREQDAYLAESDTYQTWRLMANMKELLAETVSQVLARRYGALDGETSSRLLASFEANAFRQSAEIREIAQRAAQAGELEDQEVFGRIMRMLHFVSQQFWESKKQQLLSTSRLRTYLLKRDIAASLKTLVWEYNSRINLDRVWKPQGKTFINSLPLIKQS